MSGVVRRKALAMTFRFAGHILPTTDILMSDRRLMTVVDMRYKESQSLIWLNGRRLIGRSDEEEGGREGRLLIYVINNIPNGGQSSGAYLGPTGSVVGDVII